MRGDGEWKRSNRCAPRKQIGRIALVYDESKFRFFFLSLSFSPPRRQRCYSIFSTDFDSILDGIKLSCRWFFFFEGEGGIDSVLKVKKVGLEINETRYFEFILGEANIGSNEALCAFFEIIYLH